MEDIQLFIKWDDITCPICLDSPHNAVLLQCSSYENGCRSFVCDTDHLHSNCLNRFKQANGLSSPGSKLPTITENIQSSDSAPDDKPACPLCRGEVTGWVVDDRARTHLDSKKRHCEEEKCRFTGTYTELQKHVELEHPHACPSKVDPARQLDWENFQQSSEIIDVLSTIHTEIPRGVVLGDYVIEYGYDNSGDDDFEGFHREGNWWTSCMLYQVFENFRASRNRRRSRVMGSRRLSYDASYNSDEGSPVSSMEYVADYNERDDDFVNARRLSRGRAGQQPHSSRRRRSRFY